MSDHDAIRELLPGYALDCLQAEEEKAVREHLAGCQACRQRLESFGDVSARLSLAVPLAEPPRRLEGRIMRRIDDSLAGRRASSRRFPQFRHPALAAAAAVLIVALAVGNILQLAKAPPAQPQARPGRLMTAIITGTGETKEAYGTIVLDPQDNKGVLAVNGLPSLDAEHQYQLWLIKNGQLRSGGVFSVDAEGYGSLLLTVPSDFKDFRSFGISIEPLGGSQAPTGAKIMSGGL
jgi:anti-sigma-K factor RskA